MLNTLIGEVSRFPELGEALYSGGRAIISLAAAQFNWLVMSAPMNRAMLLGDHAIPSASELQKHAVESVQLFLVAYRH
jgi:TetR/AcrR family transcriptional regulator, mexJK operon transcriptional repressor